MKKQIDKYMDKVNIVLDKKMEEIDWKTFLDDYLNHILFYQHERLIHLIVLVIVAILTMMSIGIAIIGEYIQMFFVTILFLVLLIPYIFHYMFLENSIQKMYEKYDIIIEFSKNNQENLK